MKNVPELEFVSWRELHEMCFELAKKLEKDKLELKTMVSISRGGHVVSRILSDFLGLAIYNVSIQSYQSLKQKELKMTQKLGQYLDGERVLLVDEIVDTGRSLKRALSYLNRVRVLSVYSVALHVKPQADPKPDAFAEMTSKWVVYPYEVRETIESVVLIWKKAGWSVPRMRKKLIEGGFCKRYVDKFLVEN